MRAMPTTFVCDHCQQRHDRELLCWTVLRADPVSQHVAGQVACVRCCGCETHRFDDPGGVAVFAVAPGEPLTWRGLDDSEHRTRRHQ